MGLKTHRGGQASPKWPAEVAQIRRETQAAGVSVRNATDQQLSTLFEKCCQSVELTVDALLMIPRPTWLNDLCGARILLAKKEAK